MMELPVYIPHWLPSRGVSAVLAASHGSLLAKFRLSQRNEATAPLAYVSYGSGNRAARDVIVEY